MLKTARPANRTFNTVMRHTVGRWFHWRYQARYDAGVLQKTSPPFLLVGNHTSNLDAFLMSVPVKGPVHFVASDAYFRTPFMRMVFRWIGGIPKSKNISDSSTIRTLFALRRAGAILGLYPEGNRSWEGVTGPLFPQTAKLIKKLHIPVISVRSIGGSLVYPRWADAARKGPIWLDYRLLFSAEDCSDLSEEVILTRLEEALALNDAQETSDRCAREGVPFRYSGKRLAERLERFLFQCPACEGVDTLTSKRDHLFCRNCRLDVRYLEDGGIVPQNPDMLKTLPEPTLQAWHSWQCKKIEGALTAGFAYPDAMEAGDVSEGILMKNSGALLETGNGQAKLQRMGMGTLKLLADKLTLEDPAGKELANLPLLEISGLTIQSNKRLECYCLNKLYRFSFPDENASILKWHQALVAITAVTGRMAASKAEH